MIDELDQEVAALAEYFSHVEECNDASVLMINSRYSPDGRRDFITKIERLVTAYIEKRYPDVKCYVYVPMGTGPIHFQAYFEYGEDGATREFVDAMNADIQAFINTLIDDKLVAAVRSKSSAKIPDSCQNRCQTPAGKTGDDV